MPNALSTRLALIFTHSLLAVAVRRVHDASGRETNLESL